MSKEEEKVFYTSPLSPWALMMMEGYLNFCEESGINFRVRVVNLGKLFSLNGNPPLKERSAGKLNYRLQEIGRWKRYFGYGWMKDEPRYFPFDMGLSSRVIVMAEESEKAKLAMVLARGCWGEDLNLADEEEVRGLLDRGGYDGEGMVARAKTAEAEQRYEEDTEEAISRLVFGVPTIRIGDELYWGQDRWEWAKRHAESMA